VVDGTTIPRALPRSPVARRKTPALFGLGLLEQVSVKTLQKRAEENLLLYPEIRGRLPRVHGGYGRFGWKSEFSSIAAVVEHALITELGFDAQRANAKNFQTGAQNIIDVLADYCRLIGPPPLRRSSPSATAGRHLFVQLTCNGCHAESLTTDANALPAFRSVNFHPYTDLLLHHMGPLMAEEFTSGDIDRDEFRTAPLWGITSTGPPFLHDGRAETLEQSILLHGGEAQRSIQSYRSLSRTDQEDLLAFLAIL